MATLGDTTVTSLLSLNGITASTFSGNGASLTNLNGSNIATGTVAFARLPTGTGASQVAIGNHTHSYLPLSGGTLTGAVTFANGTYNTVGDDSKIGDINVAGTLGLKGANGTTCLAFVNKDNSYYTRLVSTVVTANTDITLPSSAGTLALVGDNNHTHSYAGSSSAGGAANSVKASLTFNDGGSGATSGTTYNGSAAKTISYNSIGAQKAGNYVTTDGTHGNIITYPSNEEKPFLLSRGGSNDSEVVKQHIDDSFYYINYINDEAASNIKWTLQNTDQVRASDNGVDASTHYMQLSATKAALTLSLDGTALLKSTDISAWAKAPSKPSYTHNEIGAGYLDIGDGQNYQQFRTTDTWHSGIYYHTTGDEALVFGNQNTRTSWIFAYTNPVSRADWTTLTPSLQIKNGKVAINKLIANSAQGSYNLDVNGTINGTTLYENTVSLERKYLKRDVYEVDSVTRPTNNSNYVVYHITAPAITELTNGLTVRVHKGLASDNSSTDGGGAVKLLQINSLTPIAIFWRYNSFAAWNSFDNVNMTLTYSSAARPSSSDYYGYTSTAGFILDFTYDSGNDTYNLYDYGGYYTGSVALTTYSIVGWDTSGKRIPIVQSNGTFSNLAFDFGKGIQYWDGSAYAANSNKGPWNGYTWYPRVTASMPAAFISAFSLNTVTTKDRFYLKCTKSGTTLTATGVVKALPSSNDGFYYMLFAKPYQDYTNSTGAQNWTFFITQPIYYYTDKLYVFNDTVDCVKGPSSATTSAIVAFDGTSGKLVKNTNITVSSGRLKTTETYLDVVGDTGVRITSTKSSDNGEVGVAYAYASKDNSTSPSTINAFFAPYGRTPKNIDLGTNTRPWANASIRDTLYLKDSTVDSDVFWHIGSTTANNNRLAISYDNLSWDDKTVLSLYKYSDYVDMYLMRGGIRLKHSEPKIYTHYNAWDGTETGEGLAIGRDTIAKIYRQTNDSTPIYDYYSFPTKCGGALLTANYLKDDVNDFNSSYTTTSELYFDNTDNQVDSNRSAFNVSGAGAVRAAQKTFAIVMTPLMNINGYDISSTYSTVSGTQGNFTYIGIKYNDSELITPTRAKYYLWRMTGSTHLPLYSTEAQQGNPQYSYMVDADYNFYKIQYHPNVDTSGSVSKGYLRLWKLPGIFDRSIDIKAGNGAYAYGIRIHPYSASNYAGIVLCDSTNTGTTGTATNTWWIRNKAGTLNIGKNSTDLLTHASTTTGWVFSGKVTATSFYASSDRRLKDNIKQSDLNFLDIINALKIKEFTFKTDEDKENKYLGLIAQQLRDELPEKYRKHMISESSDKKHTLSINEGKVQYITMGAVQQLSKTIDKQQKRIDELEAENKELKKTLKEINKKLDALLK